MSSYYPYHRDGGGVKRRRVDGSEHIRHVPIYNIHHNVLSELCRSNAWGAALQRWRSFPQEASPIPLPSLGCRRKARRGGRDQSLQHISSSRFEDDEPSQLYYTTVLGMICSSRSLGTMEEPSFSVIRILLEEILQQTPEQVTFSQVSPQQVAYRSVPMQHGNTPLRDAVLNPRCPVDILKMLLEADRENYQRNLNEEFVAASHQKDSLGLSPLDHLIQRLHNGMPATNANTESSPIEMLETFLAIRPPAPRQTKTGHDETKRARVSPLLRLLAAVDPLPMYPELEVARPKEETGVYKIQAIIECLLQQEPELLYVCSNATGCSALHVAARTCNFLPIIQNIVKVDTKNQLIELANDNGDLPIHVVCGNGGNLNVLQFLARKTAEHDRQLLWTTNGFGYTLSDLLWLNHIEAGSSFVKVRKFHAVYADSQLRFQKDNGYYNRVLQESVNKLIDGDDSNKRSSSLERMKKSKGVFSGFLERLFVLLNAFSTGKDGKPQNERKYLHIACMACTPYQNTLAMPLFKLLLWIFKDELRVMDETGNLPLHHALGNNLISETKEEQLEATEAQWRKWAEYCHNLIDAAPDSCGVANVNGQLPLHLLLTHRPPGSNKFAQNLHQELIEKVSDAFPESVHTQDPVSQLDPFMLASVADDPLSTIYKLLRRCPNLCHVHGTTSL